MTPQGCHLNEALNESTGVQVANDVSGEWTPGPGSGPGTGRGAGPWVQASSSSRSCSSSSSLLSATTVTFSQTARLSF